MQMSILATTSLLNARRFHRPSRGPRGNSFSQILAAIALLSLFCACHSEPWEGFPKTISPDLTWPPPPEQGRIAFAAEFHRQADLFQTAGLWRRVGEALAGPKDSGMIRPFATALHPQGLLVADPGAHLVHFYCWAQRRYYSIGPKRKGGLQSPVGVAALPDNSILVCDSQLREVDRFDAKGNYLGEFLPPKSLGRPAGIAINRARGEVYVTDVTSHTIVVCDLGGKVLRTLGKRGDKPGEFNFPTNITVGPQDRLYVTDSMNFRVQVIEPDGKPVRILGSLGDAPGRFSRPKGITVDGNGHCIVVEGLYDTLNFFDPEGNLLLCLGGAGSNPGQFWLAAGLAYDANENLLFVADSYNSRVQVFRLLTRQAVPTPTSTTNAK